jgi:hypothetical protein
MAQPIVCGSLLARGEFDKSRNHQACSARRAVIEATVTI